MLQWRTGIHSELQWSGFFSLSTSFLFVDSMTIEWLWQHRTGFEMWRRTRCNGQESNSFFVVLLLSSSAPFYSTFSKSQLRECLRPWLFFVTSPTLNRFNPFFFPATITSHFFFFFFSSSIPFLITYRVVVERTIYLGTLIERLKKKKNTDGEGKRERERERKKRSCPVYTSERVKRVGRKCIVYWRGLWCGLGNWVMTRRRGRTDDDGFRVGPFLWPGLFARREFPPLWLLVLSFSRRCESRLRVFHLLWWYRL